MFWFIQHHNTSQCDDLQPSNDDVRPLLFQKTSSFSFSHILPFEEEFIITVVELAEVQEKQLFMESLFSLDSIYLPYPEVKRTIHSFSCIQVERILYLFL